VGRIAWSPKPVVEDVLRSGVGRYPRHLVQVTTDLVGVGTDLSGSLVLLSSAIGRPVGRLRAPQTSHACSFDPETTRLLAPGAGTAYDVRLGDRLVGRRQPIPTGKGGRLIGGDLVYLAGEVRPIRILGAVETAEPGVPVVVGSGSAVGSVVGAAVVPRSLTRLDVATLETISVPAPELGPDAVEVVGADATGSS
jgi:hypothetical protein